jgi:hypothetical protein
MASGRPPYHWARQRPEEKMTRREWDAATYDRVSGPQLRWGP